MIYLDYNATTPVAPQVRDAMLPFLTERFGNPSSDHALGHSARETVETGRSQVASLLGTRPEFVLFTSGGTESNNLGILGLLLPRLLGGEKVNLVISALEHPAVIQPALYLERLGCSLTIVPSNSMGLINSQDVAAALQPHTALVSVMHANNEIGTIQPIREISEICRKRGIPMHTDAAQSVGKIPTLVDELGVDLLSLTGHKSYAPKGIGALFVRGGMHIESVLHGAGQESGLRPGTENVAQIAALGAATQLAASMMPIEAERMMSLRQELLSLLQQAMGSPLVVNGAGADRLPNTLSVVFPRVDGKELLAECPGVCASTGSACHSAVSRTSSCLAAIGLDRDGARGTVRLSLGWYTTRTDIEQAAAELVAAWKRIASCTT